MLGNQGIIVRPAQVQSSTMDAQAWISMPGQGYPPGGRVYPCPGMDIDIPALAWVFIFFSCINIDDVQWCCSIDETPTTGIHQ